MKFCHSFRRFLWVLFYRQRNVKLGPPTALTTCGSKGAGMPYWALLLIFIEWSCKRWSSVAVSGGSCECFFINRGTINQLSPTALRNKPALPTALPRNKPAQPTALPRNKPAPPTALPRNKPAPPTALPRNKLAPPNMWQQGGKSLPIENVKVLEPAPPIKCPGDEAETVQEIPVSCPTSHFRWVR